MTTRTRAATGTILRDELLVRLRARVLSWNVSQQVAAARLGISRPCLNMLLNGRRAFSLDALVGFADAAGLAFEFRIDDDGQGANPGRGLAPAWQVDHGDRPRMNLAG